MLSNKGYKQHYNKHVKCVRLNNIKTRFCDIHFKKGEHTPWVTQKFLLLSRSQSVMQNSPLLNADRYDTKQYNINS